MVTTPQHDHFSCTASCTRAAEAITTRHLAVAVVERAPPRVSLQQCAAEVVPDARVFAVTPASRGALERGRVWGGIASTRAPSFERMLVWDAMGSAHIAFDCRSLKQQRSQDDDVTRLGWILENRVLHAALGSRLQEHAASGRIDWLAPVGMSKLLLPISSSAASTVESDTTAMWGRHQGMPPDGAELAPPSASPLASAWLPPDSLAQVTLSNGETIRARLVVGADGPTSAVRSSARIGCWGWDYDQTAVVATVRCEGGGCDSGGGATAFQRFLPEGPVALLPLWDSMYSVVWTTTPAHADALLTLSPTAFATALNCAVHGHLKNAPPVAAPGSARTAAAREQLYDRERDAIFLDPAATALRVGQQLVDAAVTLGRSLESASPPASPPVVTGVVAGSQRAAFPLRFSKANSYVRDRVALIGCVK